MEMLRESSYADLTVRAVAARAKVAPATAYTYFSSKNHLITEVYLDLVRQVPYFTDVNEPMPTRADKALRHLALVVARRRFQAPSTSRWRREWTRRCATSRWWSPTNPKSPRPARRRYLVAAE